MPTRRFAALVNPVAGRSGPSPRELEQQLRREFRAHDILLDLHRMTGPQAPEALTAQWRERPPEALLAVGGDGTARAAARVLLNLPSTVRPPAMGVVPRGTANLLAHDLGLPADLPAVASALAAASPRSMDVGRLNGEPFLCAAVLGVHPSLARHRESFRGHAGWGPRLRGWWNMLLDLRYFHPPRLWLDPPDPQEAHPDQPRRWRAVAIGNNPYSEQRGLLPHRPRLDGGELAVYLAEPRSPGRLIALTLSLFTGRWQQDPQVHRFTTPQLTLRTPARRHLRVMLDGELLRLPQPLHVTLEPRRLSILTP